MSFFFNAVIVVLSSALESFTVVVFDAPLSSLSLPFVVSSCQTLPVSFQNCSRLTNTSHQQESEDIPGSESVVFACGFLGEIIV